MHRNEAAIAPLDLPERNEFVIAERDVVLAVPFPDLLCAIFEDAPVLQMNHDRRAERDRFFEYVDGVACVLTHAVTVARNSREAIGQFPK